MVGTDSVGAKNNNKNKKIREKKRFRTEGILTQLLIPYQTLCASRGMFPLTVSIEARMREMETGETGVIL